MKVLNFQERNEFLDEVVKTCTIDGDYQPALLDVVFRLTILKYFADYDYRSEPQSEWPRIAYESFNFKINKAGCDTSAFWDQYDSLEKAVHEQIDRSHKEWLVLGLCGKLNEIIKKPDPISDFVDFMENYLNDVKGNLKDFDVEKTIFNINHHNYKDANISEGATTYAIVQQINPLEKIVELYERLLKSEQDKIEILKKYMK